MFNFIVLVNIRIMTELQDDLDGLAGLTQIVKGVFIS